MDAGKELERINGVNLPEHLVMENQKPDRFAQ
jgi:hypothetical protein